MRMFSFIWKALTIAIWLVVALLLLSHEPSKQAWGCIAAIWAVGLWLVRPVVKRSRDEQIHRDQMASLKRFHAMQARDRREREHASWWRSLGIKP